MDFTLLKVVAACAVVATLVLAVAAAAAAPQPRFVVPDISPGGGNLPQDLAVGDFVEDGKLDVAVANLGPDAFNGGVTVLPGDGAGNLGAPIETDLGPQVGAQDLSEAVDFDGDENLDLAVQLGSTGGSGAFRILLGHGDGTFTVGQALQGGDGHVEAGELTGDGKTDVVFVYGGGGGPDIVRLFPGKGDGTFQAPIRYDVDFGAYDIELGDVNGDGKLDLAGAAGGPIWVMLQRQAGGFAPQQFTFSQQLSGIRLTLADFDGDGKRDVAVVTGDHGAEGVFLQIGLGNGNGTFSPKIEYQNGLVGASGALAARDWTGDGRVDLVAAHGAPSAPSYVIVLLKGRGDGTFSPASYWNTGNDVLAPANLNDDAQVDLVAFSADPGLVYATLGSPPGFRAPKLEETKRLGEPAIGDVNKDGKPDLVMLGVFLPEPGVLLAEVNAVLNKGKGKFAPAKTSPAGEVEALEGPDEVVLADVNEDGKLDLVAAMEHFQLNPSNIWVMLGRGDGRFRRPLKIRTGEFSTDNQSLAVRDVTGDGHLDIVGHAPASGWQLAVLPGRGNGTFGPEIDSGSSEPTQAATLVADFTGDGELDTAAVVQTGTQDIAGGDLRLHRGNGNGTFDLIQTLHVPSNPHTGSGRIADLNGDRRPDVVFSGSRGSNFGVTGTWVALNQGGTFAAPVLHATPLGVEDVGDFDRDGDVDIVGPGFSTLTIRLNAGNATFPDTTELILPVGGVRAVDWDRNGTLDLLIAKQTTRSLIGLYRNVTP